MRFSTHVVLFIIIANSMIGAAEAAGMWTDWGIEIQTGVSDAQIDRTQTAFKNLTVGNTGGSTLINLFVFGGRAARTAFELATALPNFLENIGVPSFLAAIPNALVVLLVGRDVAQIVLGRII